MRWTPSAITVGRNNRFRTLLATIIFICVTTLSAQQTAPRITSEINNSERVTIPESRPAMARATHDIGEVAVSARVKGISLVFRRTDAQEKRLQALIAAQQNPSSPLYHKWLTPAEFAENFGMADSDLAKVTAWLDQQGFR